MTYALLSIGPLGYERVVSEYPRRSEALRARDDLTIQNMQEGQLKRLETFVVIDHDQDEQEWDDERYCVECQDVLVKVGSTCAECLSERASYYIPEDGGQG